MEEQANPWDVDRVLHELGLRPWKDVYLEGIARTLAHQAELGTDGTYDAIQRGRDTGSTTKMLAEAAAYILDRQQRPEIGKIGTAVLIYAAPEALAEELRQRLQEIVVKLGGDPTSVIPPRLYIYFRGGKGKDFVDRTWDAAIEGKIEVALCRT